MLVSDPHQLFVDVMYPEIEATVGENLTIPCKPTSSSIKVQLIKHADAKKVRPIKVVKFELSRRSCTLTWLLNMFQERECVSAYSLNKQNNVFPRLDDNNIYKMNFISLLIKNILTNIHASLRIYLESAS